MSKPEIIEQAIREFFYEYPPIEEERISLLAQFIARALDEQQGE